MEEPKKEPSRWDRVRSVGRWVLLVFGVGAVVYLVRDAGPAVVLHTIVAAAIFLPFVALGEIGFVGVDVVSLRLMFGEHARKVPALVWLRSAILAYGIMILFPAGRAGGEVVRAASLAPHVGGARAAAGAAVLQGVTLFGNTLISIPCYIAVAAASGPTNVLALFVAGNGLVTLVIGAGLLFGARLSKIGGWLGKRIALLGSRGAEFDASLREMPRAPVGPVIAALLGRLSQSIQYGVILVAVGGTLTAGNALIAQAIHIVGAGLGDMVPNQAGVTETAFRLSASFGPTLGLRDVSAQMVSMALVHRIVQFSLAGLALVVGAIWKPAEALEEGAAVG